MKIITNNILNRLFHFLEKTENFVFLDTSKPDSHNTRSLLFIDPVTRLQHHQGDDEQFFLQEIERLLGEGFSIAGWFSYEFGYLLESSLRKRLKMKADIGVLLADLGVFKNFYTFDHRTGETDFPMQKTPQGGFGSFTIDNLRASLTEQEYIRALNKILEYIEAGDTYQVNFTLKLLFDFSGSAEQFYSMLRRNQSVSYGAYIRWQEHRVMSFSPELFFWKNGSDVMVRPMKGTLKRGKTLTEDAENRLHLRNDVKNQSENVMIVDLLRNDLGRLMHHVSDGRVEVDSLFDVETYETLLQMTSTITGRTQREALDNLSLYDFFKAIFPCGSVTGAPKIRTMEIIDELEKSRRGIYTGAIGCMLAGGESVFNVPIRTVVLDGSTGEMGIGSGIVHDSDPQLEWQECLLKGRFLTQQQEEFQLIETILWTPQQGYYLLDEHLQRLRESALYFLFYYDDDKLKNELSMLAEYFEKTPRRLRLLLGKDGHYIIETAECKEPAAVHPVCAAEQKTAPLPRIALSKKQVDSESFWLYHKTTIRELYSSEYTHACLNGYIDYIFENERGCITEGCVSNVVVYSRGVYFTPPLSDGLLAGVMRQHLLHDNTIKMREKTISVDDIRSAERVFICNSVRGVVQVDFIEE